MTDTTIIKLARHCQKAMEGTKGKRRDDLTIQYWNGAIGALHAVDHPDKDWVSSVGWLLIATRGYEEIENIIKGAEHEHETETDSAADVTGDSDVR
jgi:hypothetical protein